MLQSNSSDGEENPAFKWGIKKGVARTNHKVQFYESFTYEGIEYRLFDCAYFYVEGQCETSIGKIVRMYETSEGEKKIKVIWFFRPIDIHSFLREYEPQWDELFLACGDGKGVYSINDVEAIVGKCNVICVSRDKRNPKLSRNEARIADYVFSHTFDTRPRIISEDFADAIVGIKVENFFNKIRDKQPLKRLNSSAAPSSKPSPVKPFRSGLGSTKIVKKDNRDGKLTSRPSAVKKVSFLDDRADHVHVKKNPPVNTDTRSRDLKTKTRAPGISVNPEPSKKRKRILNMPESDDSDDLGRQPGEKRIIKNPRIVEKAPSQNIVKSSWYKKLSFEEEVKAAIEKGRLLLIENLEPSYTSLEVEDICRQAFNERVDAQMIPASPLSSPHSGRALVIFATTKAADYALSRLTKGCLMLTDQRPLVGFQIPVEMGKCRRFPGHFGMLDRSKMHTMKRNAVSTSHCAQPNHIVYYMAMEWFEFQGKSELKWKRLFEQQAKEINGMRSKSHRGTQGNGQYVKSS